MEDILLRGIQSGTREKAMSEDPEYSVEGERIPALEDFGGMRTRTPFDAPLLVQRVVVPYFLEGINVVVEASTGSGKTLAYCIPLVEKSQQERMFGVILVPNKVLVRQIARVVKEIRHEKLVVGALYMDPEATWISEDDKGRFDRRTVDGGSDANAERLLKSRAKVLVTTIDGLLYVSSKLDLGDVTHLVMDEADTLINSSSVGVVLQMLEKMEMSRVHFSCFSATMNREVVEVAECVGSTTRIRVNTKTQISHEFVFGTREEIKHLSLMQVIADGIEAPALIFVKDEGTGERLSRLVERSAVYRECSPGSEDNVLDDFRLKKIWYLFTTDALSRGVDFYSVRSIVNYDIPSTKTQFIHRAGRINRGCGGQRIYTIYSSRDLGNIGTIVECLEENRCAVPEHIKRIVERNRVL